MKFEDHFSKLAGTYSKYRPKYPSALYEFISGCCKEHIQAWDCGTGNGQAALELTNYFERVLATDASKEQIEFSQSHPKITYRVELADRVSLENSSTDLVTVAAAVHWFEFEKFYSEVKRVLKPGGIIAVWGYHLFKITPDIDNILIKYYSEILKDYWPERFHYVDTHYEDLPFPFKELTTPKFEMITEWDLKQVVGFLNSWSGTKNYEQKTGRHPLNEIWKDLSEAWGNEKLKRKINWPLHLKVGKT
ncbi:MAG: class I SAM-dependent methyltransferase [Ignavibacteriaceae bacterium]